MVGLSLLDSTQPTFDTLLITHLDPAVQVLGGEILAAAELIQQMHDHLSFGRMALTVVGIAVMTVIDLLHLFLEQLVRDQPLAIRLQQLPRLEVCGRHKISPFSAN